MTPRERRKIKELGPKAKKWMALEEGQRKIKKALKEAKEISDQFKEASKFDPKSLRDPMTM